MKRFLSYCAAMLGTLLITLAWGSGASWTVQAMFLAGWSFIPTMLAGCAWFIVPIAALCAAIPSKEPTP